MPTTRQTTRQAKKATEVVPSVPNAASPGLRRSKRNSNQHQQQKILSSDSESFSPSEDESSRSEEEIDSRNIAGRKKAARRSPRTPGRAGGREGRRQRGVLSSESEDDEENLSNDESEKESNQDVKPPTKIGRTRLSKRLATNSGISENTSPPDSIGTDEEQPTLPRSSQKGSAPILSESSDDEVPSPGRRGTPLRLASKKANKRFTTEAAVSTEDDQDELERMPMIRKRKHDEDDESYQGDESSESDTDDGKKEGDAFDDTDTEIETSPRPRRVSKAKNIDNDNFLDADDSSDDEQSPKRPMVQSPQLEIRPSPKGTVGLDITDEASENEIVSKPESPKKAASHCKSSFDAITMEPLPSLHVCYYPPDQSSCQCFALSTLHKIALSGQRQYDENGKVTFKQPPHFRERASDELLYQIISRFGRAATDVFGGFYTGKKPVEVDDPNSTQYQPSFALNDPNSSAYNEFSYMVNYDGTFVNNERFLEQVNDYMNRYMGSKDIYCCPLCYSEAHRRFENQEAGLEDPVQSEISSHEGDFPRNDPLEVLGCPDKDCFRLASTFCFRRQVQLKNHLKQDHKVDLSVLDGTDLFKRFMFRASDGLLQRYLDRSCKSLKGRPRQGLMAEYWGSGNNEIFIYLIHLIERGRLMIEKAEEQDPDEESRAFIEAREFVDEMLEYQESFSGRADEWWDAISAPYSKGSQEEVDNFIDGDNNSEDDEANEAVPHHIMRRAIDGDESEALEDEIVSRLRARRFRAHSDEGSSSDDGESEDDDDEAAFDEEEEMDDVVRFAGYYSEASSEEDDWMKERRQKRKTPTRKNSPMKQPLRIARETMKRVGRQHKSQDNQPISSQTSRGNTPTPQKRRRILLEDSDDE